MKTRTNYLCALLFLFAFSGTAVAQDPVETVVTGCAAEIEAYCSMVSPGEGRLLACFYAHEDKLSGQCSYALYAASAQLEQAVSALNYVAGECQNDITTLCAAVEAGDGRIAECLLSNKESVSAPCAQAMDDVIE